MSVKTQIGAPRCLCWNVSTPLQAASQLAGPPFLQLASGGLGGSNLLPMRILAIDHGTKRMGIAVSDELKMIAHPLEFIPADPFAGFLARLKTLLQEKEVELILVGMPRNMDGSYGEAAIKVREFVNTIREAVTVPIRTWDERLTSAQANRLLIQTNVRRGDRKARVDKTAAAILLQSFLDGLPSS